MAVLVREARRSIGMSQTGLAVESGLSLATIQNSESARANPSLSTLRRVLDPLGFTLAIEPENADWDALASLGLPLTGSSGSAPPSDPASLRRHIRHALLELSRNPAIPDRERKEDCVKALLLAIRRHFPSRFNEWFGRSPLVRDLVPAEPTGRMIKLSRIAVAVLAGIL